jgi:hypothetical protein
MRELYDADVWQLKKMFRRVFVATAVAGLVTAIIVSIDF